MNCLDYFGMKIGTGVEVFKYFGVGTGGMKSKAGEESDSKK